MCRYDVGAALPCIVLWRGLCVLAAWQRCCAWRRVLLRRCRWANPASTACAWLRWCVCVCVVCVFGPVCELGTPPHGLTTPLAPWLSFLATPPQPPNPLNPGTLELFGLALLQGLGHS
jgi:hypothetical protein